MGISTTPYTQNDYSAANQFRPYNLPIDSIVKANMALNQYWTMGAQRVKSVYDNALGLNEITDENKGIRDNFMKDSEQQLTQLSSMDLGDPGVQRQGIGIYAPLFANQNIIGEDHVLKNYNNELSIGDSYRTKDGGKNYNPLSIQNMQVEKSLLSADPNSPTSLNRGDGWKTLYNMPGGMSKYDPQIDSAAELKKITDIVKGRKIQTAQSNGNPYIIEQVTHQGATKQEILDGIEEMGSPALKQQMRVEGRNAYYMKLAADPTTVDAYYQQAAGNFYDRKINEMQNSRDEMNHQLFLTPKTSEYHDRRESYTTAITAADATIKRVKTVDKPAYINSFTGLGNVNNLGSNVSKTEQLSQSVAMDNLATSLATDGTTQEIKPNLGWAAYQTNIIAGKRLNQETLNYLEKQREYEKTYLLDKWKAENPKGLVGTETSNVLNYANPDGSANSNLSAVANEQSKSDVAAKEKKDILGNPGEALNESFISNFISPSAWQSIQQGVDKDELLSNVLTSTGEMDDVSNLFKVFADKYGDNKFLIPKGMTENQVKGYVSNMHVSQFKALLGTVLNKDPEFTLQMMQKLSTEKNPNDKTGVAENSVLQLRNTFNRNRADDANTTSFIKAKITPLLPNWVKYFDNNKSILTDNGIETAYNNAIKDPNFMAYHKTEFVPDGNGWKTVFTPITKAEYSNFNPHSNPYISVSTSIPSLEEFKKTITNASNNVLFERNIENLGRIKSRSFDKDELQAKREQANAVSHLLVNNSPTKEKNDQPLMDWIVANSDKITAVEGQSPIGKSPYQTVTFKMDKVIGSSTGDVEFNDNVDKVNKAQIEITSGPRELQSRDYGTASIRHKGAQIINIPTISANGRDSGLIIENDSPVSTYITPKINVNNIVQLVKGGKNIPWDANMIEAAYEQAINYKEADHKAIEKTLAQEGGRDQLNGFFTKLLSGIEKNNNNIKENK